MAGTQTLTLLRFTLSLLLALSLCAPLRAQTTTQAGEHASPEGGKVAGHVRDASGLVVPRAGVTLRNTLTGANRQKDTSDAGEYSFSGIPEGRYSLSASAAGLATEVRLIEISREASPEVMDIQLPLARVSEQVTVVSGSRVEELQNESPVRVDAVTRDQIRNTGYERVSDVLAEIPGVVTRSGSTATVGAEQIQGIDSRQVLVLQDALPIVGARGIKSGIVNLNRQDIGKLERVEVATALTACHAATCRSLPEPKTPFNMPLTAHSATCPPCRGVNGRPLTATGWGKRIRAAWRYAEERGSKSSISSSGRPRYSSLAGPLSGTVYNGVLASPSGASCA
jgi:hypothetical protein